MLPLWGDLLQTWNENMWFWYSGNASMLLVQKVFISLGKKKKPTGINIDL